MSNDTTRDAFEAHAATMGFDLTRRYLAVPEPWSEYVCPNTGCFWAGWQAATEQGKRQPAGYQLVPIEPTDAMAIAAVKASLQNPAINGVAIFRAMLAAAPATPQGKI